MDILKNLFGRTDTKIDCDEIVIGSKLLSEAVIVDRGSNANGHYVKWGNGLQLCWQSLHAEFSQTYQLEATWVFPKSFISAAVFPLVSRSSTNVANYRDTIPGISTQNNTQALIRCVSSSNSFKSSDSLSVVAYAIGFWK